MAEVRVLRTGGIASSLLRSGRGRIQLRQAIQPCQYRRASTVVSAEDIDGARRYCSSLLSRFDVPSYTLQTFIQPSARDAYLAIRAFNIDVARVADSISNEAVGKLRMQFWRDAIEKAFSGAPPKEPVAILLWAALQKLQERGGRMNKARFLRLISAREKYMTNAPYASMSALESYAESTYSNLLYLTLSALQISSVDCDHLASHIGKATGIAAVLRGLPLIAFPPPANHHSATSGLSGASQGQGGAWTAAVPLPLDVMAETGLKEEDVFRLGSNAPGLKDAVFKIATLANDHLLTARKMLKNFRAGQDAGHAFEYEAEYQAESPYEVSNTADIDRAFGVFLPAVSTQLWLDKLEKVDFDILSTKLRQRDWRLPWRAFWAFRQKQL